MNLLDKVDIMIIGGGMAFTFIKEAGVDIGSSLYDAEGAKLVPEIKRRQRKERFGEDGNEEEYLEESFIHPGRAIEIHGLPQTLKKAKPDSLAKPALLRNSGAEDAWSVQLTAQYPEIRSVLSEPQQAL